MGLLDGGLQGIFGAAFGGLYLDGTLQKITYVDDGTGSATEVSTDYEIKGQIDAANQAMREQDGYSAGDMRIIILQADVPVTPNTDHRVILGGKLWNIANIEADPANTHWVMRGTSRSPAPEE